MGHVRFVQKLHYTYWGKVTRRIKQHGQLWDNCLDKDCTSDVLKRDSDLDIWWTQNPSHAQVEYTWKSSNMAIARFVSQ